MAAHTPKKHLIELSTGEKLIVFKGKKTITFYVRDGHLELDQVHCPPAERPDDAYIERIRKQLWKWYVYTYFMCSS